MPSFALGSKDRYYLFSKALLRITLMSDFSPGGRA